jgi:hypothetical protein
VFDRQPLPTSGSNADQAALLTRSTCRDLYPHVNGCREHHCTRQGTPSLGAGPSNSPNDPHLERCHPMVEALGFTAALVLPIIGLIENLGLPPFLGR